jgi:UDP-glucose 4-epimerase
VERRAKMKFLLIGGIGYVGGRLAEYLKKQNHTVVVTTRRPVGNVPTWLKADRVLQVDPYDTRALGAALSSIDVVIDLAAPNEIISGQHPQEAAHAGRQGTTALLQAVSDASPRPTVIYVSTVHVYGNNIKGLVDETTTPAPAHPYAEGKYEGERVIQDFRKQKNLEAFIVRLSNAYGAPAGSDVHRWSLVFNDLCRQAVSQQKLVLKSTGKQRRNFITLGDAVRALEFLAVQRTRLPKDGIIHVGSDSQWSILEAADKVASCASELWGVQLPVVVPPEAQAEKGHEFEFSVERLRRLGFSWTSLWKDEIKATLALCKSSDPQSLPHA